MLSAPRQEKWLTRLCSLVLVGILWLGGLALPAQAATQLTGRYAEDTLTVVKSLRSALQAKEKVEAEADTGKLIDAFAARYHGPKFDKLTSYTMLRTVSNTVASNYRSGSRRPLKPEQIDRVLAQLDKAEQALKRE